MRILSILLMLLPFSALAEGARMVMDCQVTSRCDVDGTCVAADVPVQFELAPVSIDADGAGTYSVTAMEETYEATAPSRAGPFVWDEGNGARYTLTLTSEDTAIGLMQDIKNDTYAVDSKLIFMNCMVIL
ncbi:hypothetical protein [Pseudooceanicola sp. MF1-13]|uniref:hypothetical protein n=1 Tax=Pseudooceanicola sp. MF1-13 TaxID=3379095 RepID=UPI003891DB14